MALRSPRAALHGQLHHRERSTGERIRGAAHSVVRPQAPARGPATTRPPGAGREGARGRPLASGRPASHALHDSAGGAAGLPARGHRRADRLSRAPGGDLGGAGAHAVAAGRTRGLGTAPWRAAHAAGHRRFHDPDRGLVPRFASAHARRARPPRRSDLHGHIQARDARLAGAGAPPGAEAAPGRDRGLPRRQRRLPDGGRGLLRPAPGSPSTRAAPAAWCARTPATARAACTGRCCPPRATASSGRCSRP